MSAAPRTLADTGIAGVIVDREIFTSQDVFNAGFEAKQEGVALGMVLAGIEHARHAQRAAGSAVSRIVCHLARSGLSSTDTVRTRDLNELAAQYRALADALEAAAPALRNAA